MENLLNALRAQLAGKRFKVGNIEHTDNNYNEEGDLIEKTLPTITTEHCEIGIYKNIYFVFIIKSKLFNEIFFESIKDFLNIKLYGLKNFKEILYPTNNFGFAELKEKIRQDDYLQIEFDFDCFDAKNLRDEYVKLVRLFDSCGVEVIDQLKINLKNI